MPVTWRNANDRLISAKRQRQQRFFVNALTIGPGSHAARAVDAGSFGGAFEPMRQQERRSPIMRWPGRCRLSTVGSAPDL
jgi:hypothetical protein